MINKMHPTNGIMFSELLPLSTYACLAVAVCTDDISIKQTYIEQPLSGSSCAERMASPQQGTSTSDWKC